MWISLIPDIIKLHFRKDKELFLSLHAILGFYPKHIEYYKLALMHKSVDRRNAKGRLQNNERLEFLGDAILGAVVGDIVYRHFKGKREGFLTNTRSKVVQREMLNTLAYEMGINKLVVSSNKGNSHNSYVGGNAFEALIGAIYLDKGYSACMRFMQKKILSHLINIDKVAYKEVNFKSKLIEWSQKNKVRLNFQLIEQKNGDKGSPLFIYMAKLEGLDAGKGTGYSKKESQQVASKEALQHLRQQPQFIDELLNAKSERLRLEEKGETNALSDVKEENILLSMSHNKVSLETEEPVIKVEACCCESQKIKRSDNFRKTPCDKTQEKEDIVAKAEATAYGL